MKRSMMIKIMSQLKIEKLLYRYMYINMLRKKNLCKSNILVLYTMNIYLDEDFKIKK